MPTTTDSLVNMRNRVHREFVYSAASLLTLSIIYISQIQVDQISWILTNHELPFETMFYVGLMEIFKVALSLRLYPTSDSFNSLDLIGTGLTIFGSGEGDGKNSSRLPYTKRDTSSGKAGGFESQDKPKQFLELLKGILCFIVSVAICHMFLVLFGAPVLEDWKLTMQFSFVLVCWLFCPLCMVFRPATIISELFYISLWDAKCSALMLAKWRFLVIVAGTWAGAIVVPLDWDRPWQKWPIPCLSAAVMSHLVVNVIYLMYLTQAIYGASIKNSLFPKPTNKVKSF